MPILSGFPIKSSRESFQVIEVTHEKTVKFILAFICSHPTSSTGRSQSRAMPLFLQVFFNTEKSMIKLHLIIEYNY
jgi:hypothetical protein